MTASPDFERSFAAALERHLAPPAAPARLAESIRYSLLAPGKRIRPRLMLACSRMLGLAPTAAMPAAIALEMIHCFTLIHDDLPCMDDDDFRRGQPSNHKRFGEATALLAGDALMALAVSVFADAAPLVPSEQFSTGLRRMAWAMGPCGVIGGQAAEEALTETGALSDLEQVHAAKTGALFSAALLIPMDLVGLKPDSREGRALALCAREFGHAFQEADDLADKDPGPKSLLHYMSPSEAQARVRGRIIAASDALGSVWGKEATELIEMIGALC